MICFADEKYDSICRKYAWLGINTDTYSRTNEGGKYYWQYDVEYIGQKFHGNSIMAAIGLVQLKTLDKGNKRRREIAAIYDSYFESCEGVWRIPVNYPEECSYHIYEIAVKDRDGLILAMREKQIAIGVHYRDNTEYSMYAKAKGTCPYASHISRHLATLPMHLFLTDEDVRMIAEAVCCYTEKSGEAFQP